MEARKPAAIELGSTIVPPSTPPLAPLLDPPLLDVPPSVPVPPELEPPPDEVLELPELVAGGRSGSPLHATSRTRPHARAEHFIDTP
jgi:hypothetical protein